MSFQSTRKRNLLLLGGSLLAATLAVAPGATGPAAWAAPQPTESLDYVALGDSYAVGLDLGVVEGEIPGCGQTAASYPRQLALDLGLELTDVTCSGATTENITNTAQVTGDGTNPVQSDALSAGTDIVTVTIGGNDLGFTGIIQNCLANGAAGPLMFNPAAADCMSGFTPGGIDSLAAKVTGPVTSSLTNTLATIHQLAPNAKVFVVGYPALMPDAVNTPPSGCFTPFTGLPTAFPFTDTDVAYLHDIQTQFDTAMSTTATAAGATFVPMLSSTLANSPCANNTNAAITGVSLTPGAMHPNAFGAGLMTAQAVNAVQAGLTAPTITPGATSFSLSAGAPASLTFAASGFPQPTLAATGQLPAGMNFDSATGVLSGTPTTPGISTFSLTATNSVNSVTEQYTVSVNQAPAITSAAPSGSGTVGTPYSFMVTATGFPVPTLVLTGELPDGLQFAPATGEISGTPTAAGTFSFGVTATNTEGSASSPSYSIQVEPAGIAPEITSANPPAATLGKEYSFTLKATGFPAPTFAVASGTLPDGLSMDPTSGAIAGTPTAAGSYQFAVTASNQTDPSAKARYTLVVAKSAAEPPVTPTTPTKPAAVTPGTSAKPNLASTGSNTLLPLGVGGGIALLAGAALLLTRRTAKG